MNTQEIPVAFECEGDSLIGVIHVPEAGARRGVLTIVAGGPQYRGGCCRQLVQTARALSAAGTPVMRFDYRGLGDGAGPHQGFRHIGPDIAAAIATFRKQVPGLEEIVLWGGCDAASAAMIHGPSHPRVTGLMLGNPFVHSEETAAKALVKHYYLRRLRDKGFWKKVLRLEFNPLQAARSLTDSLGKMMLPRASAPQETGNQDAQPFPKRMLEGMQRFEGRVLLMMSGLSLVSKEFDELVNSSREWRDALGRLDLTRVDFPQADQAFSTNDAREKQIAAAIKWLEEWPTS